MYKMYWKTCLVTYELKNRYNFKSIIKGDKQYLMQAFAYLNDSSHYNLFKESKNEVCLRLILLVFCAKSVFLLYLIN